MCSFLTITQVRFLEEVAKEREGTFWQGLKTASGGMEYGAECLRLIGFVSKNRFLTKQMELYVFPPKK